MTLYRHFGSKDALVLAFLDRREARWTKDWLQHEVERRAVDPAERLLAIFDVFDEWFQREDFEGARPSTFCSRSPTRPASCTVQAPTISPGFANS